MVEVVPHNGSAYANAKASVVNAALEIIYVLLAIVDVNLGQSEH